MSPLRLYRRPRRGHVTPRCRSVDVCEPRVLLAASVVTDLDPTPADSYPAWIVDIGGAAFFNATTTGTGNEIWKSDGTPGGTVLVRDVRPGPAGSDPQSLVPLGGVALFVATTDAQTKELWKTDGTAAGTVRVSGDVNLSESS